MLVHLTKENFDEVVNNNPIVLIDFFATWCGPCKMLAPVIEELADEDIPNVVICKVDVDEERELANKFGITSIPTLFVMKDGKVDRKAMGFKTKEQLKNMIKY